MRFFEGVRAVLKEGRRLFLEVVKTFLMVEWKADGRYRRQEGGLRKFSYGRVKDP